MPKRILILLKLLAHLLCLAPLVLLLYRYTSGALVQDPDPVNSITHFTGNWAIWMLLACLAVTPLRRLSPRIAWLVRFRRLLGLYAFFYATLHLATYIFLFSGYDLPAAVAGIRHGHPGVVLEQWRQTWPTILDDIQKRRFIQVGFAAWCILFALAVTSPAFVTRAMGGVTWRRLHRLIYVAGVLAVIHYWWLVKTGVRTPWKDTAVLAVLLASRIVFWLAKKPRSAPATTK